jgi:hypothetical protein
MRKIEVVFSTTSGRAVAERKAAELNAELRPEESREFEFRCYLADPSYRFQAGR